jgi:hypothetical protein
MKSIAIHQPNYIPWLGYFYKISQTDFFVFLDDAQFSNQGMHNYHYIKTPNRPLRIKIPVFQTLGDKINEVRIKNELGWREKHLTLLQTNYKDAEHFEEAYTDFKELIYEDHQYLSDLNITIIKFICNKLGIKSKFIKSSDLNINSIKETKIIDICTALGANIYYSGTGARAYQNEQNFLNNGIQLKYSEYNILKYKQQHSGFQSNVTVMDFLMNCSYRWDMVIAYQNSAENGNRELH